MVAIAAAAAAAVVSTILTMIHGNMVLFLRNLRGSSTATGNCRRPSVRSHALPGHTLLMPIIVLM